MVSQSRKSELQAHTLKTYSPCSHRGQRLMDDRKKRKKWWSPLTTSGMYEVQRTHLIWEGQLHFSKRDTLLENSTVRLRFYFRTYSWSLTKKEKSRNYYTLEVNTKICKSFREFKGDACGSLFPLLPLHLRTDISQPEINCEIQPTQKGVRFSLEELSQPSCSHERIQSCPSKHFCLQLQDAASL